MIIEVSNGELFDKWTILCIKLDHVTDGDAHENVKREHSILSEKVAKIGISSDLLKRLMEVNMALWSIEDDIRRCEHDQDFSDEFITLARSVYLLNDDRADIKREINETTNSLLVEEKVYTTPEEVDEEMD